MIRKIDIFLVSICSLLLTACQNNGKQDMIDEKQNFKNYIEEIIVIVKNNSDLKIEYKNNSLNSYNVYENRIIGFNYNNDLKDFGYNLDYSIVNYNVNKGIIYEKNNGEIYLSLETDEFCAFKDFNDSEIKVYDISEEEKCHKFNIIGNEIFLTISANDIESKKNYDFGTISDGYISLTAISNILDKYGCVYKWYRNNELIENINIEEYVIPLDKEDADYHAEIIIPDGTIVKSNVINVKIDRK